MTAQTLERVVLDRYNGQDTLYLQEQAHGTPRLSWMLFGQVEDFDLFLDVNLSWTDVEALAAHRVTDIAGLLHPYEGTTAELRLTTEDGSLGFTGPLPDMVDRRWALAVLEHVMNIDVPDHDATNLDGTTPRPWHSDAPVSAAAKHDVAKLLERC